MDEKAERVKSSERQTEHQSNGPTIHFVYSGNPYDDKTIQTPVTITNRLFMFLRQRGNVKYYNLDDKDSRPVVKPGDIILGHPHPSPDTVIWKLFEQPCAKKYLLWPFHTGIPEINRYSKPLAAIADKLFVISGPYWTDTLDKTEYAGWKDKIVRVDNAVDSNIFALRKRKFNLRGQRGLLVFSRSGEEKGIKKLFGLLNKTDYPVVIAGDYSEEDLQLICNRPKTTILGHINWLQNDTADYIVQSCDFSIGMPVSDASPTTLLETMAIGLIPITTPQCGYYYPSFILLSADDQEHNLHLLRTAQHKSEEELRELQTQNRHIIEENHNWEKFCRTIWGQVQKDYAEYLRQGASKARQIVESKPKKFKVAEDFEQTGTQVDQRSTFGRRIKEVFAEIRPKKIIETGTYLGRGTTTIIANALKELDINDALFYTIEVNPQICEKARQYLIENKMRVEVLNGLSVPREMLPSREEIARKTVTEQNSDDIFVDHKEETRVDDYFDETNFPDVADDLLYKCLKVMDFKPDFVLLDSGGHIGEIEFNYLVENLAGPCYIALDDIYHVKHHKSFKRIQSDSRFEVVVKSDEKFGFCIAKFTPAVSAGKAGGRQPAISYEDCRKVLIVRTDSIGDFVIFSAVLPHLRQLYKNAEITFFLQENIAPLAENCPYIDKVVTFSRKKFTSDSTYAGEILEGLKRQNYDTAIYPVYSRDSIGDFITLNSGAKTTITSFGDNSNISIDEKSRNDSLYTKLVPASTLPMIETERNREFVGGLGARPDENCETVIWITEQDKEAAEKLLSELQVEDPIVICPFGQYEIRNWPVDKWARLLDNYRQKPILICGIADDKRKAEQIIALAGHPNIHNLCGRTTLRELAALLDRAAVCVCVESAAGHIAAAVGCPQVVITGGGHFGRFLPYSPTTALVYMPMNCFNCNWICTFQELDVYCISQIKVETVDKVVGKVIQTNRQSFTKPQLIEQKTELLKPAEQRQDNSTYLVTAIVSTYNSQRHIAGCLEDLESQTIADKIEIVVVDSGSKQDEGAVVKEFQKKYDNIRYIRTKNRETVYKAWNRAIEQASGRYITNANTDDRHRKDALEVMADTLDKNPDVAVVYSDQHWVDGEGKVVNDFEAPEHSRWLLLFGKCYVSSNPMWRKSIHESCGLFDGDLFFVSGDYEFWLRVSQQYDFKHINQTLGIRRFTPDCISRKNVEARDGIDHLEAGLITKCYHRALEAGQKIDKRGISGHPQFGQWPEVKLLREKLTAKLEDRKIIPSDYIRDIKDYRKRTSEKLSIVIDSFNRKTALLNNLSNLDKQTEKDFEVIVVDRNDGPVDLQDLVDKVDYDLCQIILKDNFGPGFARNIGINTARAGYVAFLDEDSVAHPDFVKNIFDGFKKYNTCAIRGKILPLNEKFSIFSPDYYDIGDEVGPAVFETSGNCAFRKDVLTRIGGFDEDLFVFTGQEISYKIYMLEGEKIDNILYLPQIIVYQNYIKDITDRVEKSIENKIGKLLAMRKWCWQKYNLGLDSYLELIRSSYPANRNRQITNFGKLLNIAIMLQENNPQLAIRWAEEAIAANPAVSKGYFLLGSLYFRLGKLAEAEGMLEKALNLLMPAIMSKPVKQTQRELEIYQGSQSCYLSSCTKLAHCYMLRGDFKKLNEIYTHMLTNHHLEVPDELRSRIKALLGSLGTVESVQTAAQTKNFPIVFIHWGDSDYLKYTLAQAYLSNPQSKIYLIGDRFNDKYDFVEHHDYTKYCQSASRFERVYKHLSPNSFRFELMCFLRWFILQDFLRAMNIKGCLYLDSDVMIYADLPSQWRRFALFGMTSPGGLSPGCNFISDIDLLNEFCDFLIQSYTDTTSLRQLEEFYQTRRSKGLPGISDMIFLGELRKKYPNRVADIGVISEGSKYENNINIAEGFEMESGRKKIYWLSGKPHGKLLGSGDLIALNILHFQGVAKNVIKDYCIGKLQMSSDGKKWSIKKEDSSVHIGPAGRVATAESCVDSSLSDGPVNLVQPAAGRPRTASRYLVTAIVSTYNAEKDIGGCLDDLENQTIADWLEIIVVNSGSKQNEDRIVKEFQKRYGNIKYIRTEQREGVYAAWNKAVRVAEGQFLTNANTDDRHSKDALGKMAKTLLANPDIALVYGDQIVTKTANDTFDNHHGTDFARRPEYSRDRLLFGCCVGSQPMWQRRLHDEFGYFDETLDCAGDWDFWLRVSEKFQFQHIPEFLGLYFFNEEGIEHGRKIHSLYERYLVGKRYGNPYISVIPVYQHKDNPLVSVIMPAYNAAGYIKAAIESVLIQNYRNFELIIVDDGSTDDTSQIVAGFKDDKIRYFKKENGGPASARNFGVKNAGGSFLVFLDADDMMVPNFISSHLEEFEKKVDADLVYCDDLLIDQQEKPIRVIRRPEYAERKFLVRDLFRCGFPVVPFRGCIKKTVFEKIGLYEEALIIAEDYDMIRRAVKNDVVMHHLNAPLYLRRMTEDGLSRTFSIEKAKSHFKVLKRFTDTFGYDELFPDVKWGRIEKDKRELHGRALTALTYLTIGQGYAATNCSIFAQTARQMACYELKRCLAEDPGSERLQQMLKKCEMVLKKSPVRQNEGVYQTT